MTMTEIDFVVADSLAALELYGRIFDVQRIEATALPKGNNEAVFAIYGTRLHMLDENPAFGLYAPKADAPQSLWFNVTVPDIAAVFAKALECGCREVQAVTDLPDFGVSNAVFADPFGYMWMLHQVHREVSFDERAAMLKTMMEG